MYCSHTPATFYRLRSCFDQHWEVSYDFILRVSHRPALFFYPLHGTAISAVYFSPRDSGEKKMRYTELQDLRQLLKLDTRLTLCLYCLTEFNCVSVCDALPVFPPSVRSHDLVTDTGLWSIVYLNKLDSLTTDWETDWDQRRAGWSVWSPPTESNN